MEISHQIWVGMSLKSTSNNESQTCPAVSSGAHMGQREVAAIDRVGGLWVWIQAGARDKKQEV